MNARLQHWLPHHWLSRLMGFCTNHRIQAIKNWQIRTFSRVYGVDMSEVLYDNLDQYPSFNAFFTRALKPEARPIDASEQTWVSPVDGCVSQAGRIEAGRLLQAKGQTYTLAALLADDTQAKIYQNGHFATFYLAPKDYHRVHMPIDGTLKRMTYIPGRVFSVNPNTVLNVPQVFARNERVVCEFETPAGPMTLVLVGAMLVASIHTMWHGQVTPPAQKTIYVWDHETTDTPIHLARGAYMGHFELGSTVILLSANAQTQWASLLKPEAKVKMGAAIGRY